MSYLSPKNGRRATLGFIGRVAKPLRPPKKGVTSPSSRRSGMGETFDVTPMPSHPEYLTAPLIRRLQAELNRYVGSSLGSLVPKRIAITGVLDQATAYAAWRILVKRAGDAMALYGKEGEARPLQILLANASMGASNQIAFIGHNVKEATEIVGIIADQAGLPPPVPQLLADKRVVIGAGAVGVLLLLLKGKVL